MFLLSMQTRKLKSTTKQWLKMKREDKKDFKEEAKLLVLKKNTSTRKIKRLKK